MWVPETIDEENVVSGQKHVPDARAEHVHGSLLESSLVTISARQAGNVHVKEQTRARAGTSRDNTIDCMQ